MKLTEMLAKLQEVVLINRIMLAESDEQKECFNEKEKSYLKKQFNFPELTSDLKINIASTWIKFTTEYKNEEKDQLFASRVYVEPFDFLTEATKYIRELKLSNCYLTVDAERAKKFPLTQIRNFFGSAEKLLPRIVAFKYFLDYIEDLFKDNQSKEFIKEYDEFYKKEKHIFEEVILAVESLTLLIQGNGQIDSAKFSEWFFLNNDITKNPLINNSNTSKGSNYRNEM